jgi:uncharacterized membrane protein
MTQTTKDRIKELMDEYLINLSKALYLYKDLKKIRISHPEIEDITPDIFNILKNLENNLSANFILYEENPEDNIITQTINYLEEKLKADKSEIIKEVSDARD